MAINKSTIIIQSLRVLSWFPLPLIHAMSTMMGLFLYYLPNGLKRVAAINISLCFPELSESERRQLLRDSLIESVKTIMEMGAMWFWSTERLNRLNKGIVGFEIWQEAYQQGKGVIALTPHIGQWEFLGLFSHRYASMTSLYRPPRLEGLNDFLIQVRKRTGNNLAPTTPLGVKMLYSSLRKGHMAGILPDQDPGSGGVFAPFFGIQTNTMNLISKLAGRTHSPIIIAYAERLPRGRGYITHIHAVNGSEITDPDPVIACGALNRAIETCVREQPAQYQWIYKRFKKRPEGEEKLY